MSNSRLRIGINGFGRMGRLVLRAGWEHPALEFVALNEPHGDPATMALLLEHDSVQGHWPHDCAGAGEDLTIDGTPLAFSRHTEPARIPWGELGVELVLECSGRFRTSPDLRKHLEAGAHGVLVSAPVADGPPNIVVGVNDGGLDLSRERLISAASCTTNGLAPIIRVLHDGLGIERGLVTTLHDPTNTQSVHDCAHTDPRRARASQLNLIPTSTNSATAVTRIIPELEGKLDSIAVRVPVMNASLIDCVFQVARDTTVEEVNGLLDAAAAEGPLVGILGSESRPLVSSDYAGDPRSSIVDSLSTRVTDKRLVKVLAWYDNEWGYVNRMLDLAERIAGLG
jgi:glyceraldehyde-3-phosphate dehydrogenase (arsenate-transferring)